MRAFKLALRRAEKHLTVVDRKLAPPYRQQIEFGFGPARNNLVADPELPFPLAWSDRRYGVFDALVDHGIVPLRPGFIQPQYVTSGCKYYLIPVERNKGNNTGQTRTGSSRPACLSSRSILR